MATVWWNGSGWQTTEVNCVYQSSGSTGEGGYVRFYTKISASDGGVVNLAAGLWAELSGSRWANVGISGTRTIRSNGSGLFSLYSGDQYKNANIPSTATISFEGTVVMTGYTGGTWYSTEARISAPSSFTITSPFCTISYNANGGSGAPSSVTVLAGRATTLSSTIPTRSGWTFKGWATSNTATTATYSAGGSLTPQSSMTLYAVWYKNITITADEGVTISFGGTDYTNQTVTVQKAYGTYALSITPKTGWILKTRSPDESVTQVVITKDGTTPSNISAISATSQRVGCHIDDGNQYVQAVIYMDTGNDWQMIQAYYDNGNSWELVY